MKRIHAKTGNQDSKQKKRIFLSPPHMGGEEARFVQEAFDSNYIAPLGPQIDLFEREFAEKVGMAHAVAVSSGTAAMHLALRGLGIEPGDEIYASTLTFIGSVTPIVFERGTPVFIDSDRSSWNMDPGLLEAELKRCAAKGHLPKAVIPTDLYGQCCDYDRIFAVCAEYNIPVIVDAAEAMGAYCQKSEARNQKSNDNGHGLNLSDPVTADLRQLASDLWRHAGVGGRAAVYSFNGNKIMTTSGGGMLASDDKHFVEQARFLSQQARDPFIHYEHSEIGYNYRMSNILAAIGRGQLKVLDKRVKRKKEIFDFYKNALGELPGIDFMPKPKWSHPNHWLTVILITPEEFGADREQIRLALEEENIESRPVWKPMHMQPVFDCSGQGSGARGQKRIRRYAARVIGGKVAEDLFNDGLCLPSGTAMNEGDLNRVVDVIVACRK